MSATLKVIKTVLNYLKLSLINLIFFKFLKNFNKKPKKIRLNKIGIEIARYVSLIN